MNKCGKVSEQQGDGREGEGLLAARVFARGVLSHREGTARGARRRADRIKKKKIKAVSRYQSMNRNTHVLPICWLLGAAALGLDCVITVARIQHTTHSLHPSGPL